MERSDLVRRVTALPLDDECRLLLAPPDLDEAADLVSRSFLASPVFAGIDTERYLPDQIANSMAKGVTLAMMKDGVLASAVTLFSPDANSLCEPFRRLPQLGLLGVEPGLSGRGIGTKLVGIIEQVALRVGWHGMALSVTTRGETLAAFYERLEYRTCETFHWPGVRDPSFIMVKALEGDSD